MTTPATASPAIPVVTMPGTFPGASVTAPVYVDSVPVTLAGTPSTGISGTQDFWSSQLRSAGDPTVEQLTVTIGQARLINYISLDLPHFPHTATFFWWDGAQWQTVNGTHGAPLRIVTTGSVPGVVDSAAALSAKMNPYHYGAGHWVAYNEMVEPFTASMLMICGVRPAPVALMQLPVNSSGKAVPYPLGVQNLDFGSRVLSAADAPATPRSPVTLSQRQPYTTTVDVNGSPVQIALRENRAGDMLAGGTWRCGPQPSSSSVASLYLDSRDEDGNAQVIDRFFLDPISSGVKFNLYYSAAPPPAGTIFDAIDDPLLSTLVNAAGTQLPVTSAAGIAFGALPGWLTLSNQAAGTVADEPWWTGIEVMPAFNSEDPNTYIIADAGLLQLSYADGAWSVTLPDPSQPGTPNQPSGGTLGDWAFDFDIGDRLQFIAGFDGQSFFAWTPAGGVLFQVPVTPPVPPAPVFRFGGLQSIDPSQAVLAGNYTLTSFILKQEAVDLTSGGTGGMIPDDFLAFAADASAYVSPPLDQDQSTTVNAVARFSPDFILGTVNQWGFAGGLGSAYEACTWVPVQRSYTLARGYVEFDPVLAAAWKFEFTSLQPEPYEYFQPSQLTAQLFPPQAQPTAEQLNPSSAATLETGLAVNQNVAPTIVFNDVAPAPAAPTPGTALPNEALFAPDPSAAAQMASLGGSLYNFQQWQAPAVAPVTAAASPAAYQEQTITVTSRVAYFVALNSVTMYRIDYTATDDTEQYVDKFDDTANVNPDTLTPGGWAFQQGTGLVAPSNLSSAGASVQSQVLSSVHAVTGVQFATVQSDPVQLLPDADFSQPGFPGWGPVGDALPLAQSPNSAQLGTMVQVSRGSGTSGTLNATAPGSSWAFLESAYTSWGALEAAIPAWDDFALPAVSSAIGGIGFTGMPLPTTGNGRLFAAARVFSNTALTAPLFIQILDGATGTVIAEAEQSVLGGTVTEWFAGFTLGQVILSGITWEGVEAEFPTWADIAIAGAAWDTIDTSQAPLGATVSVQLIQKESTTDTWDVDNISVFMDGLVWEFSNDGGNTFYQAFDVRNNPNGVVPFPPAPNGSGNQLVWQVTAYQPGLTVSALAVRPWYVTWPRGIMPRVSGVGHGPNASPADQYGPVADDPRWQLSSSPVPESWFFSFRQATGVANPGSSFPGPAPVPPSVTLGNALVWEPPALAEQEPQTFTDLYTDAYTDQYAPADGGFVYTDTYCDIYGPDQTVLTGDVQEAVASFDATGFLDVTAAVIPLPAFGAGANFGGVSASNPAVTDWLAAGFPLPARYIALGSDIPATLAASAAAEDAGVRRVQFDLRPDSTTTPAEFSSFLESCQAGGLEASVSIWADTDAAFANPQDWLDLLPGYVGAIHQAGYQHVLVVSVSAINGGWLDSWYPGDDLVDVIAPVFGSSGVAPGSSPAAPTLAVAEAFADAHGKPFGLGGWAYNNTTQTPAQGIAFIQYVQGVFTARKKAALPCYDLLWTQSGDFSLLTAPLSVEAAYKAMAAAL